MKEKISEFKTKIKPWHWWVFFILIFSIVGFISISNLNKETYSTLYSGLSSEDMKDIEKYLSQNGIKYVTDSENSSISVLPIEVSNVKMELANVGLPGETNPGYELLDQSSIGSTKDERELKYKRALKGQLEKDLVNGIDSIQKATVHFETKAEENIFTSNDTEESKASVIIEIKRGKELKEEQVKGIQHLISSAIEGMKSENVVVMDSTGNVISDFDNNSNNNNKQSEITDQTESKIKKDINTALTKVFGEGSVQVSVRAEINFDEIVRNIEKYDPEGTLVSRHRNDERYENREPDSTQEVGVEANVDVPEYSQVDGNGNYLTLETKNELIENFEVGKTIETIKKNPELQYLTVSVAVNQDLTPDEINSLTDFVAAAAGIYDKDRDGLMDNGTVNVTPFIFKNVVENNQDEEVVAEEKSAIDTLLNNKILLFSIIGLLLIVLILIVVLIINNKKRKKEKIIALEIQNEDERKLMEKEAELRRLKMAEQVNEIDDEVRHLKENLNKEATNAAEENPKRTAEYVNKLINEG